MSTSHLQIHPRPTSRPAEPSSTPKPPLTINVFFSCALWFHDHIPKDCLDRLRDSFRNGGPVCETNTQFMARGPHFPMAIPQGLPFSEFKKVLFQKILSHRGPAFWSSLNMLKYVLNDADDHAEIQWAYFVKKRTPDSARTWTESGKSEKDFNEFVKAVSGCGPTSYVAVHLVMDPPDVEISGFFFHVTT